LRGSVSVRWRGKADEKDEALVRSLFEAVGGGCGGSVSVLWRGKANEKDEANVRSLFEAVVRGRGVVCSVCVCVGRAAGWVAARRTRVTNRRVQLEVVSVVRALMEDA